MPQIEVLGGQDPTKQLTAISGGNPPDVLVTYWNNIGPWSEPGAVLSLQDLMNKDNFEIGRFIPFKEAGITAPPWNAGRYV